jgi:tetratricopeptide (TPR) repeat protein
MFRRSLTLIPLLILCSTSLTSQQDTKENCDLLVRVRTLDERSLETPVQVQVLAPQGLITTANVVGDQTVHFHVSSGKSYRLNVSGTGIQTITTTYFDIEGLEQRHTETVHVRATDQKQTAKPPLGSATISVSEMYIPDKASAEMKKGIEAYAKGDFTEAASHFEKAASEYPRYARAYDMLGAIAIKQPDRVKARDLFMKSIEVDNTFSPAYVDLARMELQDKRYGESESLLTKAVAFNPSLPAAVALLTTTEFANKEYDKALADVERTHALRNHEEYAEVHVMAGRVLRMQNHPDAAIAQFQLFLNEKPESPEAESVRQSIAALRAARQP